MSDQEPSEKPAKRRQRGIFERPKGSGVWWARYHDEYGREHREKAGSKRLAAELYRKRKTEIAERRFFPERLRRRDVLLQDFLEEFCRDHVDGRLRNAVHYRQYAARWTAELGKKPLRQIVPGDIARFARTRREAGFAPASINRELAFLRRTFTVAIADEKAENNPVLSRKRRGAFAKENNQRVRWLTDDEETRLRTALGEPHWPKVAVGLHSGFRRMNCFRLRWAEDVNFDAGTLRAHQPKGGTDYHVPMNDELREILRTLPSRLRSPWVFPSEGGTRPLDSQNFINRVFRPALRRAKITNFSWHDLRHTFASRLAMAGVDIRTIQELLGHQSLAMTLRYAHLSPAHKRDAVRHLERARTGTTTGTSRAGGNPDGPPTDELTSRVIGGKRKWRRPGSNRGPRDYEPRDDCNTVRLRPLRPRNRCGFSPRPWTRAAPSGRRTGTEPAHPPAR
jgi:integrase